MKALCNTLRFYRPSRLALALSLGAMFLYGPHVALAGDVRYDLHGGQLDDVLLSISQQSGQIISFDAALVSGRLAGPVQGLLSSDEAIALALKGSGLTFEQRPGGAIIIVAAKITAAPGKGVSTPVPVQSARLETVVVTAQKREESVQQVPIPVSVFSARQLESFNAGRAATDITRFVANTSSATIDNQRPRWWVRGIGTGDQRPNTVSPVGIYIDDVYLNNVDATSFPLFDQERVEVLKGPQGTLWGKNTTGGAINFISRKPDFRESNGYIKLDAGSYANRTLETAAGGVLVDDRLAGRVSLRYNERDGLADNKAGSGRSGDTEDTSLRLQLAANLSDTLDLLLSGHYRDYRSNGNGYDGNTASIRATRANGENSYGYVPRVSRSNVYYNAPGRDDLEHKGGSVTFNWLLDELTLTSITAYEDVSRELYGDRDYTPQELSRAYRYLHSKQWTQEVRLASPKENRFNWVTGLHYFHEDLDFNEARAAVDSTQLTPYYNSTAFNQVNDSYAVFGSASYAFNQRWKLTGGARWTHETKDIDLDRVDATGSAVFLDTDRWWRRGAVSSPLVTTAQQDTDKGWSDLTWELTPEYRINDHARVYFRYAQGFRSGGFNTGVTNQASVNTVDPEYLDSYELGLKSEWLEGRLNFNTSVFYYDYKDIQLNAVVATETGGSRSTLTNGARGKLRGAELEVEYLPIPNLHIQAGLGLLHSEFTDYQSGTDDYSGNRFVRAPSTSSTLAVEYRQPLSVGGHLVLSTDWSYRSKQFYFANNQTDPLLSEDAFTLGNLGVAYQTADEKHRVALYFNNVTDRNYLNHSLPASYGGNALFFGEPRTVGVSLSSRW